MKKKFALVGALALASISAFAQENDSINKLQEVVVSDSKFALAKEKSGKVIVKITSEELQKKEGQSLATILNQVAGLEINGSQGVAGQNLGVYMRGGRSYQTLVLIDGIPVNDASGITAEYDLRLLNVQQIESIEILKGASSTLYGTGAATGVISITLKKSAQKTIEGNVFMSVGTQETASKDNKYHPNDYNQGISINGKVDKFSYFLSGNMSYTTGISEVKGTNFEVDPFLRTNTLAKIGYQATKKLNLDFFANYDVMNNSFDGTFDGTGTEDTKLNKSQSKQYRFGFSPKFKYNKGELVLNSSFNTIDRSYDIFDAWTSTVSNSKFKGRNATIDLFNKYTIIKPLFIVLGGQFQFNEMSQDDAYTAISRKEAKFNTLDPYITAVLNTEFGLNINTGARYNMHNVYGNQLVYNVNPSFSFKKTLKLLTSYSTAYIVPSLYQLYSPYGNLDLKPEKDVTIEAGFEVNVLDRKLNLSAVAFQREFDNFIGFGSKYENIEGIHKTKGVEIIETFQLYKNLKLTGNYTYTETEEALSRRIPKHKANVSLDFQATSRLFVNASYLFTDKRMDSYFDGTSFTVNTVNLNAYKTANATIRYSLIKNKITIFASAYNILNEDFEEVVGYNTRGRNFKIGFNFNF